MYVDGEKFVRLIATYGEGKGYPEKSYLPMFCKDFDLAYNQWYAYTKGKQVVGTKILQKLMEIFPDLNLNWFMKDEPNMFIGKENPPTVFKEPEAEYVKEIVKSDILNKMEEMLVELRKVTAKAK